MTKSERNSCGKGLNPRQSRFVDEYLVDMNATAAYKRAGYAARGKSAEANASRLLWSDKVQAELSRRMQERAEKVAVTQEWVLDRLRNEALNHARSSARVQALKLLGEHLGMFVKRSQVEVTGVFERIAAMEEDELRELLDLKDDEIRTRLAGLTGQVGKGTGHRRPHAVGHDHGRLDLPTAEDGQPVHAGAVEPAEVRLGPHDRLDHPD